MNAQGADNFASVARDVWTCADCNDQHVNTHPALSTGRDFAVVAVGGSTVRRVADFVERSLVVLVRRRAGRGLKANRETANASL